MIIRKVAIEVIIPIFNDKTKRRNVTAMVVTKAMMPREDLEQTKPATINIPAETASTAA